MRIVSPATLVVLSAWGARISTAVVSIYSLRVLSSALSSSEYATFIVIVSLSGWYALFGDPGIGTATQNIVTTKRAIQENPAGNILVAYGLLATTALLVSLFTLTMNDRISIYLFREFASSQTHEYASTLWWSSLLFIITAGVGASSKILYAAHRGYISNIITAAGSVIGFFFLTAGIVEAGQKVLFAVCALYGINMLLAGAVAIQQIRNSWHAKKNIRRSDLASTWHSACGFFLFNGVAALVLQVDYIIMSQRISATEIVQYFNVAKLFSFSAFFYNAILFAVWPEFTERHAVGESAKIDFTLGRLVLYGAALAVTTTVFVLIAAEPLNAILSPKAPLNIRYTVVLGFGALSLIRSLTDPYAIFLQSIGKTKPLILFALLQAPISAGLQWFLSEYFGIEGILIALVLSFLLTVAWGLPWIARLSLKASKQAGDISAK